MRNIVGNDVRISLFIHLIELFEITNSVQTSLNSLNFKLECIYLSSSAKVHVNAFKVTLDTKHCKRWLDCCFSASKVNKAFISMCLCFAITGLPVETDYDSDN